MNADLKKLGDLRRRAEKFLKTNPEVTPSISTVEAQKLFYELDVHQVALIMQNEELRRALSELESSRNAYAKLYDFAPIGYMTLGYNGVVLEANIAIANMLGLERDGLVGRAFIDFVEPDSLDDMYCHRQKLIDENEKQSVKLALHKVDGTPFMAQLECSPMPVATDDNWRCMAVVLDITERKQAEDALRKSEERFRRIFTNNMVPMAIWTNSGGIVEANDALLKLVGFSREELEAGKIQWDEITPSKQHERDVQAIHEIEVHGFCTPYEKEYRHRNGHPIPILIGGGTFDEQTGLGVLFAIDLTERKRAEEALRESEARFRQIANATNHVFWMTQLDPERVLYVSPAFERIWGRSVDEIYADPRVWIATIHPDDQKRVETAYGRWLTDPKQQSYDVEYRVLREDGTLRWIRDRGTPVYDEKGTLLRFSGVAADITERKLAEDALRESDVKLQRLNHELEQRVEERTAELLESETRFRTLFANAPDACCLLDLDFRIVDENKECERLTGYPREEFVGRNVFETRVLHPSSVALAKDNLVRLAKGATVEPTELLFVRKGGTIFPVEGTACMFPLNGVPMICAIVRDITERKQAEAERELQHRKLQLALDSAQMGWWSYNPVTHEVTHDKRVLKIYGFTGSDHSPDALADRISPDDRERLRAEIETMLNSFGSQPYHLEHRITRLDGETRWLEAHGLPIFEGEGAERHAIDFVGTIADITERVAREAEIHKNRDELRRLASELSLAEQRERQRIAQELHDGLGQLLSSAYMRMAALRRGVVSESAIQNCEAITNILRQTLDQTRSLTFELSCPMLNELGLAAALEELCKRMTKEHAIHFKFTKTTEYPLLPMDHNIVLYRATRELMMNVMKHSSANRADVALDHADGNVRISVEDKGKGFNSAKAGLGFSPSGGYGLFSIGEYIRHIGGNMRIESISNGGTRVLLSISSDG